MMNSVPLLEPVLFRRPPVLMVHPGRDMWTPLRISEKFFAKIAAPKRKVVLKKGWPFSGGRRGLNPDGRGNPVLYPKEGLW